MTSVSRCVEKTYGRWLARLFCVAFCWRKQVKLLLHASKRRRKHFVRTAQHVMETLKWLLVVRLFAAIHLPTNEIIITIINALHAAERINKFRMFFFLCYWQRPINWRTCWHQSCGARKRSAASTKSLGFRGQSFGWWKSAVTKQISFFLSIFFFVSILFYCALGWFGTYLRL